MRSSEGFTILEVVMVIGILSLIFLIGVPLTFDFYIDYQLVAERDNFIAIAQQARDAAMAGEGGTDHGVYVTGDGYVLFEGESYASRSIDQDLDISRSDLIEIIGPIEIIFDSLSGRTSPSASFSMTNGRKIFGIDVNTEGNINWEL